MSKSKRDILDTESMLERLRAVLGGACQLDPNSGQVRQDAESLRRISMTLHRWHELECGDSNQWQSVVLVRGHKKNGAFEYDDSGKPYREVHSHQIKSAPAYYSVPDLERGALRRLSRIMANYPGLQAYVQTDPRGCALYILTPAQMNGVLPEEIDAVYTRGLAVFK